MRLNVLDHGHRWSQKLIMEIVRRLNGHVSDPMKVFSYRRNWFGALFCDCLEEGMRETREWTKGEAELFAAFVSKLNRCEY